MTKEEFSLLVKGMKAVYSDPKFIADSYAMEVWYSMLKDISYQDASASISRHMATKSTVPTIADIRGGISDIMQGTPKSAAEEWVEVDKIVRSLPTGEEGKDAARVKFEKLSEEARRLVGSADTLYEWAFNTTIQDYDIARSIFIRDYKGEVYRRRELDSLTPTLQALMEKVEEQKKVAQKEPERIEVEVHVTDSEAFTPEVEDLLASLKRKLKHG